VDVNDEQDVSIEINVAWHVLTQFNARRFIVAYHIQGGFALSKDFARWDSLAQTDPAALPTT